jgi:DNA repair protein RecO
MVVQSDRALVLKRTPFGESSLVAHVLTRTHGRVHVLAKGVFRPTSRYYAVLDCFDTLELAWDRAPRRELDLLRSGALVRRRRALTRDLERFRAGGAILELCELVALPSAPESELFALAEAHLEALVDERCVPELVRIAFELELLRVLGLSPALLECAACGRPAPAITRGRVAFSAGAGGRLCRRCAEEARRAGRRVGTLPIGVLDDARRLAAHELDLQTPLERTRCERLRDFIERFLAYHLEMQPKSQREFLAVANRNAPTSHETSST